MKHAILEILELITAVFMYVVAFYELFYGDNRDALLYIVLAYLILCSVSPRFKEIQKRVDSMLESE